MTRQIGTLHSLQVGTPHHYDDSPAPGGSWTTSFFRQPSEQPRWLSTTHLDGNEQADRQNHGRPDQAVLLYAAVHYPLWRAELGRPDIGPGGFAENLTIAGLSERTACIGDVYALGEAQIQVTGPRYPCWKIERRWGIDGLTARVAETGRTGWYCRVRREGLIETGMPIMLLERPFATWTVDLTNDIGHGRNRDWVMARELAACPLLNEFWRELVLRRASRGEALAVGSRSSDDDP